MARFFKSPADLVVWLKKNCSGAPEASAKMITLTGSKEQEQDIVESVRRIFANEDIDGASRILFGVLSKSEITEADVKTVNDNMHKVVAADALLNAKVITADDHSKMIKEAQIMRQPGEYQAMPLRVCPKLPKQSAGQQLISTYNCRHYCLDSIVFDEEPLRVYCAESIWRKHVMDKFSREWKNDEGEWVGGYINNRFYKFPTAGTPDNPDVPRDHGNRMQLNPRERTRQPKPHEYSTERRLEEQRKEGSTNGITLPTVTASFNSALLIQANKKGIEKLSFVNKEASSEEDKIVDVFGKLVELQNTGLDRDSVAAQVVKETGWSAEKVVKIQSLALRKMQTHQADVYSIIMGKQTQKNEELVKKAQIGDVLFQATSDVQVNLNGVTTQLPVDTVVVEKGENTFEEFNVEESQGTGKIFSLINPNDISLFKDFNEVLNGFQELGEI